jgi:hypothetical protein
MYKMKDGKSGRNKKASQQWQKLLLGAEGIF